MTLDRYKAVQKLLKADADINISYNGFSPLALAIESSYEGDLIKLLIRAGVETGSISEASKVPPLMLAAAFGKTKIVSALIDFGANTDERSDVKSESGLGLLGWPLEQEQFGNDTPLTALQVASINGYESVVHVLLSQGADLTIETIGQRNALFFTASQEKKATIRQLIMHGRPDQVLRASQRAVLKTLLTNDYKTLRLLLSNGVNANITHPELQYLTSLEYMVETKDKFMEEILLKLYRDA